MVNALLVSSVVAFGLVVAMFVYAAYWALSIRRTLAVRLHRNQALGTALVAVSFALLAISAGISSTVSESSDGGLVTQVVAYGLVITSIMYFVDSSVLAARRLDPLFRDVFGWTRLRFVLWPLLAGLTAATVAVGAVVPNPPLPLALFGITPALLPAVSGILALSVSRARSADLTFKRHLTWFALFGGIFLVFVIILGVVPSFDINSTLSSAETVEYFLPFPPAFAAGYFLYRAAKSLVPLNRMSLETDV